MALLIGRFLIYVIKVEHFNASRKVKLCADSEALSTDSKSARDSDRGYGSIQISHCSFFIICSALFFVRKKQISKLRAFCRTYCPMIYDQACSKTALNNKIQQTTFAVSLCIIERDTK